MHKRIIEAIKLAISQRNNEDLLDIYIQPKENTDGFWKMIIIPKKDYKHLIPHLETIGKAIGSFYGEGLNIIKTKEYIKFS